MKPKYIVIVMIVLFVLIVGGYVFKYINSTTSVVYEEFNARELLRKYEWFKDVSATLDKKLADIGVYQSRIKFLEEIYEGVPRREWNRADADQYNIWLSEISGVKASYNSLAAEYNSAHSKINWRFMDIGQLPAGATEPLPREFKSYIGG